MIDRSDVYNEERLASLQHARTVALNALSETDSRCRAVNAYDSDASDEERRDADEARVDAQRRADEAELELSAEITAQRLDAEREQRNEEVTPP